MRGQLHVRVVRARARRRERSTHSKEADVDQELCTLRIGRHCCRRTSCKLARKWKRANRKRATSEMRGLGATATLQLRQAARRRAHWSSTVSSRRAFHSLDRPMLRRHCPFALPGFFHLRRTTRSARCSGVSDITKVLLQSGGMPVLVLSGSRDVDWSSCFARLASGLFVHTRDLGRGQYVTAAACSSTHGALKFVRSYRVTSNGLRLHRIPEDTEWSSMFAFAASPPRRLPRGLLSTSATMPPALSHRLRTQDVVARYGTRRFPPSCSLRPRTGCSRSLLPSACALPRCTDARPRGRDGFKHCDPLRCYLRDLCELGAVVPCSAALGGTLPRVGNAGASALGLPPAARRLAARNLWRRD